MELSITTDYHVDPAVPQELQLRRMAAAGFPVVHWCYEWNVDVEYGAAGYETVRGWLTAAGLGLLDTHGVCWSGGRESAADPQQRAAGLRLHRDRIRFTAALGGDTVVIHPPDGEDLEAAVERQIGAVAELQPLLRELGITLSIENTWPTERNRAAIPALLAAFGAETMGFCFDSGHANLAGDTEWLIAEAFPRLSCLHLHDNDGQRDLHQLPGQGTCRWDRIIDAIAAVGYRKPLNFELSMTRSGYEDEEAFLAAAWETGRRLTA